MLGCPASGMKSAIETKMRSWECRAWAIRLLSFPESPGDQTKRRQHICERDLRTDVYSHFPEICSHTNNSGCFPLHLHDTPTKKNILTCIPLNAGTKYTPLLPNKRKHTTYYRYLKKIASDPSTCAQNKTLEHSRTEDSERLYVKLLN